MRDILINHVNHKLKIICFVIFAKFNTKINISE
jgi:hypothetical protein